jgi:hypothetical protein
MQRLEACCMGSSPQCSLELYRAWANLNGDWQHHFATISRPLAISRHAFFRDIRSACICHCRKSPPTASGGSWVSGGRQAHLRRDICGILIPHALVDCFYLLF